jgi:DNA helicase-2/ATP-dependent DNA helicase PcrA
VQRILETAGRLIAHNTQRKHKEIWSELGAGPPVRAWTFASEVDEARRIARTIAEQRAAGKDYGDFAIFYRTNAVSRGLEEALRDRGIPYKIARGVEFYNRREIRDTLAYLRALVNPADDVALLRIINTPARGIGKTTIDRLQTYANETGQSVAAVFGQLDQVPGLKSAARRVRAFAELLDQMRVVLELPVSEAVSHVLTASGLEQSLEEELESGGEDRLANLRELVTAAFRYEQEVAEPSLDDFLKRISLTSDQDAVDENAGVVMLMTLHAAKGLEFPVVFLAGLDQGLLPHDRALQTGDVEEERRLCFVGITRAQEELTLTHVRERFVRGRAQPRPASQFLRELDDGSLAWEEHAATGGFRPRLGLDDGFVPLVEDLPAEDAARLVPKRRWGDTSGDEFVDPDDEALVRRTRRRPAAKSAPEPAGASPFAGWQPGTLVQHERYGVGQVVWIRPAPGQTRACVRFAGHGEKTLILEVAPVKKLQR